MGTKGTKSVGRTINRTSPATIAYFVISRPTYRNLHCGRAMRIIMTTYATVPHTNTTLSNEKNSDINRLPIGEDRLRRESSTASSARDPLSRLVR